LLLSSQSSSALLPSSCFFSTLLLLLCKNFIFPESVTLNQRRRIEGEDCFSRKSCKPLTIFTERTHLKNQTSVQRTPPPTAC
jgi:hypothetical protein